MGWFKYPSTADILDNWGFDDAYHLDGLRSSVNGDLEKSDQSAKVWGEIYLFSRIKSADAG